MHTKDKISRLRKAMQNQNLDACLIPLTDPHQGEYIGNHWNALEWYSGFTGSAGNLLITNNFAGLWTDSRYFIQAESQLSGSGIELMKLRTAHAPEYINWIESNLGEGVRLGVDFRLIAMRLFNTMRNSFMDKNIDLENSDIAFSVWADRPGLPDNPVFEHDVKYAGKSRKEKLQTIREKMANKKADFHLLSALDDIAWSFNLRGSDVPYNPVFLSYSLIGKNDCKLFIHKGKVAEELKNKLAEDGIELLAYNTIDLVLSNLGSNASVLINPAKTSRWLFEQIPSTCVIIKDLTIPTLLKSVKNDIEIGHIRKVMVKDGVALVKFFMWLESQVPSGNVTEVSVAKKLAAFRAEQEGYYGESFSTIAGYKDHGAIVHYRATLETDYKLEAEDIFLLDSGGQYIDGTTDVTRTIALGEPTKEQVQNNTLVLKGHIALATCIFPEGAKGYQLEGMARRPLWSSHQNYGHGTGHGVGFFLNVHEGPQAFGTGMNAHPGAGFVAGMFTSNEPGYYEAGAYGLRIENLVLCVEAGESSYGKFLKFDTVTLFPLDTNLIDFSLLDDLEIKWINTYHQEVFQKLSPHLNMAESEWLKNKTSPVFSPKFH